MRFSTFLLPVALSTSALAIPIPASYTWTFTQWSSGWYGVGWANFVLTAPETTVSGITIPAISFSSRCFIAGIGNGKGGPADSCNEVLVGDKTGRSVEVTLRDFDTGSQLVELDTVYRFVSGGKKYIVEGYVGRNPFAKDDVTIPLKNLREDL
ncbi:hypothetical protein B0J11DRAFT_584619 [Dendryphion nanum]|uniref:Uncharacterized protein n=1 Tax=Dendryphion nanum TaxID=256645 RepID=A0A9P9DA05_9PLEO|nr:hypothetical protein B0J11DRAFT_584619 [Dendryphion nanum]